MILIFGGAYNGKIDFIKKKYDLNDEDIFFCKDESLDLSRIAICGIHIFTKKCVLKNVNPLEIIKDNYPKYVLTRSDPIQHRNGIILLCFME